MMLRIEIDLNRLAAGINREDRCDELRRTLEEAAKTGAMGRERYRSLFNKEQEPIGFCLVGEGASDDTLNRRIAAYLLDNSAELPNAK